MIRTVETYSCKFEKECRNKGRFDPEKYACTHGGGISCKDWRRFTDQEICGDERLRVKVQQRHWRAPID
jgi:hypothetical protein